MKKPIMFFEIFVMVLATVAFSWMAAESFEEVQNTIIPSESNFVKAARKAFILYFGRNLVSAESALWTCPQNKNGTLCQEYAYNACAENCAVACLPTRVQDTAQCAIGTCIDSTEGTCAPRSPKQACDSAHGNWDSREVANIPECKPGCCVMGDETQFVSEKTCNVIKQRTGINAEFKPVDNEVACLAIAHQTAEGACLLGVSDTGKKNCKLITKAECTTKQGDFREGLLCSAQELGTDCRAQVKTGCIEGKDEVYWFDSCGNRENIYDSLNRNVQGKLFEKNESCTLGTNNNPFAKQSSCGNCNYLSGSTCGQARTQDAKPTVGDFVCRDLSCVDSKGNDYSHGESWCEYDGGIGILGQGNYQRSLDAPGSRHFRQICLNGEIRTEACADFRNEICIQSVYDKSDFSSAACRINQWQFCAEANTDPQKLEKCEENPDCALKSTGIQNFNFKQCVPKYPPGFDLKAEQGGEVAEGICGAGSVTCTYVRIKKFFGSKKINQECTKQGFTETINNFCASLGDCGAKVNYVNEYTDDGYSIVNAPRIRANYKTEVKNDNLKKIGKFIPPLRDIELVKLFGKNLGKIGECPDDNPDCASKFAETIGMVSGASGLGLAALQYSAVEGKLGASVAHYANGPVLGAVGNAVIGAVIGAAVTAMLIKYSGIGKGMSKGEVSALIVLGAISGAAIGLGVYGGVFAGATATTAAGALAWIPVVGWIVAAGIAIYIGLGFIMGVGKKKETKVTFTCLPWQPPLGGDKCEECGKDGFPCSKYRCDSLGQACKFLPDNEGTGNPACVSAGVNDITPPMISPNHRAKLEGYSYTSISERGFRLTRETTSDGCLPAYSVAKVGINLDKPGQCKIDETRTDSYKDMENFFGSSNLFKLNHTMSFSVPSLDAIAASNNISTSATSGEFSFYVRCSNVNGNANDAEYAINFCISPAPDRTAPILSSFNPASPAPVAFGANELNVSFYTNEPAECKWSDIDQDYNSMQNEVACDYELEDGQINGWPCRTTIPVTSDNESVYFRCNDQPWLTGEESDGRVRNVNSQSTAYEISRALNELKIDSLTPKDEKLLVGGLPTKIILEAKTSGGAPGASKYCAYDFGSTGNYVDFFESGLDDGNLHRQKNIQLWFDGNYTIPVKCYSSAGDVAFDSASIGVSVDSTGPKITRVYDQSGAITAVTDENSVCRIKRGDCSFDFVNGTIMDGQNLVHTSSFDRKITQSIKCKDTFGNLGACISVQGSLL